MVWETYLSFARIPAPLHSTWIEYRREVVFGLGFMPGDHETGFAVYRLTNTSAQWARTQGDKLRDILPGGSTSWYPTPVGQKDDAEEWPQCNQFEDCKGNKNPPSIVDYLDKYGFPIQLADGATAEADEAIRSKGSFYHYGQGGSVTIVDPGRGKVYFAYAG
jgi:hypothetical protein